MPIGEGGIFQPSAAKWNILGTNDASFNDGTGIFGLKKDLLATDSNPYKFSAYRSGAWTAPSGYGKVSLETELFDTNSNFDSSTNYRYTAPVTGFYLFAGNVQQVVPNGNGWIAALYKGGVLEAVGASEVSNDSTGFSRGGAVVKLLQMTAGEYVELWAYGAGGAGATGKTHNYLTGFLVSRT